MPHLGPLLSTADKFVFIHIPKTAGTSFRSLLNDIFGESHVSPSFGGTPLTAEQAASLDQFQVVAGHLSWDEAARFFPGRRLITFLRDPIDRCLSIYGHLRQQIESQFPLVPLDKIRNLNDPAEAVSLAKLLSPEDFFRSQHPHVLQNISNRMVWQLGAHAAFEKRAGRNKEEVFQAAAGNLKRCDFVGIVENMDASVARFQKYLNLQPQDSVPVLNITHSAVRKTEISEDLRRQIARVTTLDNKLYKLCSPQPGRP